MSALADEIAEECVLGCILLDQRCVWKVRNIIAATDFFSERHAETYAAALELWASDQPIDAITLRSKLDGMGRLGSVGGDEYLLSLTERVPTVEFAEAYARLVRAAASRRKRREAALRAIRHCEMGEDDRALSALSEAIEAAPATVDHHASGNQAMELALAEYVSKPKDQSRMILLGLPTLNAAVGGVGPGYLIVIGAHTNVGKSSIILSMATAQAQGRRRAGIVSLEDPQDLWGLKLLGDQLGINPITIADGELSPHQATLAKAAAGADAMSRIHFAFEVGGKLSAVLGSMTRLVEERSCDILYVDYLQAINIGRSDRREGFIHCVNEIKALASRLRVPVVVTSQLRRKGPEDDDEPTVSQLLETSTIEHSAEAIILLWRGQGPYVNGRVAKLKGRPGGAFFQLRRNGGMLVE